MTQAIILKEAREAIQKKDLKKLRALLTCKEEVPNTETVSLILQYACGYDLWDIVSEICLIEGDNQPTQAAINAVLKDSKVKDDIGRVAFICEESRVKPTVQTVESIFKDALTYNKKQITEYLCFLGNECKPGQTVINWALEASACTNDLNLFRKLCAMEGDNKPSLKAISAVFKGQYVNTKLNFIECVFTESKTHPDEAAIDCVLERAYQIQRWDILEYLCFLLPSENKPSQAAINKTLQAVAFTNQIDLFKKICSMKGTNRPSNEAINQVLEQRNVKFNKGMVKFLCEESTTKPSQIAIETVLATVSYNQKWDIVSYLCALTTDNKPSQPAIDKVLIQLSICNQFELFKTLCRMQGNNQPSTDAINKVFEQRDIKFNLAMIKFMCEESTTKPGQLAIEAVLKSVCSLEEMGTIEYLCLLTSTNKPSCKSIDAALQTLAASNYAGTVFTKICFMEGDNKPSAEGIKKALLNAARYNKAKRVRQICEMADNRRPCIKATSEALIVAASRGALETVHFFSDMSASNKPEVDAYSEACCRAAMTGAINVLEYFLLENKTIRVDQTLMSQILLAATDRNQLEVIKYLFSDKITIKPEEDAITKALLLAINNDFTKLVQYFLGPANKFTFNQKAIEDQLVRSASATRGGGLRTVQSLVQMKPKLVSDECIQTALNEAQTVGNIDVVICLNKFIAPALNTNTVLVPVPAKSGFTTFAPPRCAPPQKSEERCLNEALIEKLTKYITRIEAPKNSDGTINFTAGFWFFWHSRAENRRANYNLAVYLRNKLQKHPDGDITKLFRDVDARREQETPGISKNAWVKGIYSAELVDIINEAITFLNGRTNKM